MAKSKNKPTEDKPLVVEKYDLEYRLLPRYQTHNQKSVWTKGTHKQRENIERMYPNKYEFREIKPPKPTESMIVED